MQRTNENMTSVEAFFAGLEAHDRAAAIAGFDDGAYWDTPSGGAFSGRLTGKVGLGRLVDLLFLSRPVGRVVTDLTLHGSGDRVFAEFTWASMADSTGRPPTRSLAVFELVFGKIAAVREFEAGPPATQRSG
jgi:ketosteroid isomerase-like protein